MGKSAAMTTQRSSEGPRFQLYKPHQGVYVRWVSAGGAFLLVVAFAWFLNDQLRWLVASNYQPYGEWIRTLGPLAVGVGLCIWLYRLIGVNTTVVDFMVATEGEMRKVNWSTRREVFGATRVVIASMLFLALLLGVADLLFAVFFEAIGVLQTGMLSRMFGGDAG